MDKPNYKTYDHDENKLTIKDYIEELEQDDECITKQDISFKIYISVNNKKVNYFIEVKDLSTNITAQSDSESTKFDSKKKVINWIKTTQLLSETNFDKIIKKSRGILVVQNPKF